MCGVRIFPLHGMHPAQAGAGSGIAGDRLAVSAETVVLGIRGQAGAHRAEVDVEGHGVQGVAGALHQHGLEALGK